MIRRSFPLDLAKHLVENGYTIEKLKQCSREELANLGLLEHLIDIIHKEPRPPIPKEIANKLLYQSRFTCCVCRDSSKGIIIHHIIPWEISHSHSEENLVVLCLEHHNLAHTKHELSSNLTAEMLRTYKQKWIEYVKSKDKRVANGIICSTNAYWDYFNVTRLFELGESLDINYKQDNKYYEMLLKGGYIYENGLLKPAHEWRDKTVNEPYWLSFIGGNNIVYYLKNILEKILSKVEVKVLNKIWYKPTILANIKPGDTILLQGAFFFSRANAVKRGMNQTRKGYRQARGIRVEFNFDAWYCSSSSSYSSHLIGRTVVTTILIVRSLTVNAKKQLVINGSVLAIGSFFENIYEGRFWPSMDIYNFFDYEEEDILENEDII